MVQKTAPAISVIMSVYNQRNKKRLEAAIQSILNQSFTDFELLLYNDGSDQELVIELFSYQEVDSRVRVMSSPDNRGLAYSLNACIAEARGRYLARMDDDDISAIHRLRKQYAFMEEHPEIDYVGCNAKLFDSRGVWGIRRMPECPITADFLRYSPYVHPAVMLRRSMIEEGNLYSAAAANRRCEDYEFFMRLNRLGYRGFNIQEELFFYWEGRDSYAKRKVRYRLNELGLRYRSFKEGGMLLPFGWIYVFRPLAAMVLPSALIWKIKRHYHRWDLTDEKRTEVQGCKQERAI